MRRSGLILLLLLAVPLAGAGSCEGSSPTAPSSLPARGTAGGEAVDLPATVTLAIGDTVVARGPDLSVTFTGVAEDSRCPTDVTCVWAGRAVVQVEVASGQTEAPALALEVGGDPVEARGLRLTAEALDPHPRSDRVTPPEEYRLRLRIEAAAGG